MPLSHYTEVGLCVFHQYLYMVCTMGLEPTTVCSVTDALPSELHTLFNNSAEPTAKCQPQYVHGFATTKSYTLQCPQHLCLLAAIIEDVCSTHPPPTEELSIVAELRLCIATQTTVLPFVHQIRVF